jgi:hypothetical protein
MTAVESLTKKETAVLETLRRFGKSMREDSYHITHELMDTAGAGLGFEYELTHWSDIDERFTSPIGSVPYSPELHGIIEGLIKKGYLRRNPENPIEIEYCGGLDGAPSKAEISF